MHEAEIIRRVASFFLFSSYINMFFFNFYSVTVTDFQSEKAILTHICGDFSPLSIVPVVLGSLRCSKETMKKDNHLRVQHER